MRSQAALLTRPTQFVLETGRITPVTPAGGALATLPIRPRVVTRAHAEAAPAPDPSSSPDRNETPDAFEERTDVVGFEEKRRSLLLPFWTKYEVVHPLSRAGREEENVIILDLDDIATSGSGGHGLVSSPGLENAFLAGAAFLALWFGTRISIKTILAETRDLKELNKVKGDLLKTLQESYGMELSAQGKERLQKNVAAMLLENHKEQVGSQFQRLFTGGFSAVGATGIGVGATLEMPVWAAPAVLAAGSTIIMVAAPFMSIFGLGAAAAEGYEIYKTWPINRELDQLTRETPIGNEAEVRALLEKRLHAIRTVAGLRMGSLLGLAIGTPLTVFGGIYGLALLLPSVAAIIVAGYVDGRKVGYAPQLAWQDKVAIDGTGALINAVDAAHRDYSLLKKLKGERRLLFPYAQSAPFPVKHVVTAVAWARRKLKGTLPYPSAEETFYAFLQQQLSYDVMSLQNNQKLLAVDQSKFSQKNPHAARWSHDAQLQDKEMTQKENSFAQRLTTLKLEQRLLAEAVAQKPSLDAGLFIMLRYFIMNDLLRPLAEKLIHMGALRAQLTKYRVIEDDGEELHFDANALVTLFVSEGMLPETERPILARKIFETAQSVLFTDAKNRAQARERQLLDYLGAHLVAGASPAASPSPSPKRWVVRPPPRLASPVRSPLATRSTPPIRPPPPVTAPHRALAVVRPQRFVRRPPPRLVK